MDILLLLLTFMSLAAAAVFGMAAWRARTEAAHRSAARVAALASALGAEPDAGTTDPGSDESGFEPIPAPPVPYLESRPAVLPMFASATADGRILTKPAIATAIGAMLLIGGGTILRNDSQAAPVRDASAALELVSMRHARAGRTLTVTGLLRNPSNGTAVTDVAALVFAFDRSGEFVASGRGSLELPVLHPGEEAPFAVTVTDVADVGRYRVSFRIPAGPLRHIDRRPTGRT
jgi:hypothetical protein